jgi:AcrR family transcriptional regulator
MGRKVTAQAAAKPPTSSDRLCFIAFLEARLAHSPPKQKGLRTRERLKISTAQLLQDKGYLALKVGDVTTRAGVAEGSFYMYFRDKTDATRTVLEEFLTEYVPAMMRPMAPRSSFQAICETNRRWIALAHANDGLFRCLLQFSDSDTEFAALVQASNRGWYERVLKTLPQGSKRDSSTHLLLIYLLGAMMDDLLRKLVVYPDQHFRDLLDSMGATDEDVADAASLMWLRALHGESPDRDQLSPVVQAMATALEARGPGTAAGRAG